MPALPALPHLPTVHRPRVLDRAAATTSRWITIGGFLLMHVACLAVFFVPFSWAWLGIGVGLYYLRAWGLTAGYHRLFAHRSYKATRWFQFLVGVAGSAAMQKGPLWWAGHHRTHHKHSDQEDDPHSPIAQSVWHSHIGWVLSRKLKKTPWELMKDWTKYPELVWLERLNWLPPVLLAVACYALGGLTGLVWGFVVSTVALYHGTFCVNSLCHLAGYRRFATDDHSRNNWFVALLTCGEGWHNNHHHYPSCARQGFAWYEIDASYYSIKMLSWVGVTWDVREPTPRALAHRRIGTN